MKQLFLIETTCTDPYRNLALEKYLMDHVQPGQCILYLWQNANTVVIGRNQCAADECRIPELEAAGGRLARRLSGGGAVYHDLGNLNFTFLARRADYDVTRQTEVILQAVRALGVPAEKNGRNDLTAEGKKFSGHAYYRSGDACCHHGTLMADVALDRLGLYLKPAPDKLKAKGVQSVRARVVNLARYCPGLTIPQLRQSLANAFGQVYGLPVQPLPDGFVDGAAVAALTGKFSAPGWRYGGSAPAGQTVYRARFGWGGVTLRCTLAEGRLRQVSLASDGLEADYLAGVPARLEGCAAAPAAVEAALTRDAGPGLRAIAADLTGLLFAPAQKEGSA
ncbi:MAG TPA: lipoate--protein ligase [Candidatus Gemmiger stercorigallinarum]|nr:lipoate--protein ligase [Candidatus Gemmiger stercorigallinarum]